MKNKLVDIFAESECISEDLIIDYLEDKLTPAERHFVERHLANCELCTDAVEGLSLINDKSRIKDIVKELNDQITAQTTTRKPLPFWMNTKFRIAATVAIFLIAGAVFMFLNTNNKEQDAKLFSDKYEPYQKENIHPKEAQTPAIIPEDKVVINDDGKVLETPQSKGEAPIIQNKMSEENSPPAPKNSPAKLIAMDAEYKKDKANNTEVNIPLAAESVNAVDEQKMVVVSQDRNTVTAAPQMQMNGNSQTMNAPPNVAYAAKKGKSDKALKKEISSPKATAKYTNINEGYRSNNASPAKPDVAAIPDNTTPRLIDSAMSNYDAKEFERASGWFKRILDKDAVNYNALFYAGVSFLSLNKADSAIADFDKVLDIKGGAFYQAAQWYEALAFIKLNKKSKVKKLLKAIVAEGGSYQSKADDMLKELDK